MFYTLLVMKKGKVNCTTDGAATMIAARQSHRFPEVGLNTNLVGTCEDLTIHLVVDECRESIKRLDGAIKKVFEVFIPVKYCKAKPFEPDEDHEHPSPGSDAE